MQSLRSASLEQALRVNKARQPWWLQGKRAGVMKRIRTWRDERSIGHCSQNASSSSSRQYDSSHAVTVKTADGNAHGNIASAVPVWLQQSSRTCNMIGKGDVIMSSSSVSADSVREPLLSNSNIRVKNKSSKLLYGMRSSSTNSRRSSSSSDGGRSSKDSSSNGDNSSSNSSGDGGGKGSSDSAGGSGSTSFWEWYTRMLETHPLFTKAITSGIIAGLGDLVCQQVQLIVKSVEKGDIKVARRRREQYNHDDNEEFTDEEDDDSDQGWMEELMMHWRARQQKGLVEETDWGRCAKFTLLGAGLLAPCLHFWYRYLGKILPGTSTPTVVRRLALDQFVFTPTYLMTFFSTLMLLDGKVSQVPKKLRRDFWPTLVSNWGVWMPAMLLNFKYIPPKYQVLFSNCVGFFWNMFLSFQSFKTISGEAAGGDQSSSPSPSPSPLSGRIGSGSSSTNKSPAKTAGHAQLLRQQQLLLHQQEMLQRQKEQSRLLRHRRQPHALVAAVVASPDTLQPLVTAEEIEKEVARQGEGVNTPIVVLEMEPDHNSGDADVLIIDSADIAAHDVEGKSEHVAEEEELEQEEQEQATETTSQEGEETGQGDKGAVAEKVDYEAAVA